MPMTFGSLFAGIGGFDKGLEAAGMQGKWQVENDEFATQVLAKHWPTVRRWGDVRTFPPLLDDAEGRRWKDGTSSNFGAHEGDVNAPRNSSAVCADWRVDLICGGFPCQSVSTAGQQRGEADDRWLWPEFALGPDGSWLKMSGDCSVQRMLPVDGEDCLEEWSETWPRAGIVWDSIPAAAVGAPHIRDRVWIVAYAADSRRQPQGGRLRQGDTPRCGRRRLADDDCEGGNGRTTQSPVRRIFDGLSEELHCIRRGRTAWSDGEWLGVPRVATGVAHRVDRLRCLGNAVVPQVVEVIGRRIMEVENA